MMANPRILATADDAIIAKIATVQAGYYDDEYIEPFGGSLAHPPYAHPPPQHHHHHRHQQQRPRPSSSRRGGRQVQPIIKRGTHARVCVMDRAISSFLKYSSSGSPQQQQSKSCPLSSTSLSSKSPPGGTDPPPPPPPATSATTTTANTTATTTTTTKQVIVLGSGKDTSFFRHDLPDNIRWYEVDHPSVLETKATIVKESYPIFHTTVQKTSYGYCFSTTTTTANNNNNKSCHLIGYDFVENSESPQQLMEKLQSTTTTTTTSTSTTTSHHHPFDVRAPTLFLFECVLMYLPDDASRTLLKCLTDHFSCSLVCCYEPIMGGNNNSSSNNNNNNKRQQQDPFGTVMEQNLIKAGVAPIHSCLRETRTLQDQMKKLISCGFVVAVGCDMYNAYESIVSTQQKQRANRSEFLDELEEFVLIMKHYCFVVAATATATANDDDDDDDHDIDYDVIGHYFCGIGPESALGFVEGKCQKITSLLHS